ncbi:MAG: metal-binding protein [Acaryochloridaceae cyanobacterium CSU_3_4]|nr:metal-binding protein [Acaryochloridaceae cyanobacterium CSU_3_4]
MRASKGRLVLNHSSHVPGLLAILEKLIQYPGIQTVTPGVIGRVKGHTPHLTLRISVSIRGGFKILARSGKTVQEVFVVTTLSQEDLASQISKSMS